jgi:hypothetical protein
MNLQRAFELIHMHHLNYFTKSIPVLAVERRPTTSRSRLSPVRVAVSDSVSGLSQVKAWARGCRWSESLTRA